MDKKAMFKSQIRVANRNAMIAEEKRIASLSIEERAEYDHLRGLKQSLYTIAHNVSESIDFVETHITNIADVEKAIEALKVCDRVLRTIQVKTA